MRYTFDVESIRNHFPALKRQMNGKTCIYLDGPGGSQVPQQVVDSIADYMFNHNANAHGAYITSQESDQLLENGRKTMAAFLGCDADEIAFGESSSGNMFKLATALCRDIVPGDEIIISDIDHESNRSPWRLLEEYGAVIRRVRVNPETRTLDFEDFCAKLNDKTILVALNWASNATGTVTDVRPYIERAHEVGALTVIDAVHYAAHKPIDVRALGADFLVCSAYKFFGPHLGVMYMKREAIKRLRTLRVLVDSTEEAPLCIETGTSNFENICGAAAAVRFIASIGERYQSYYEHDLQGLTGLRRHIVAGMLAFEEYEETLVNVLVHGLREIPGCTLYLSPPGCARTSTVSFTLDGKHSSEVGAALGHEGIFCMTGHFHALVLVCEILGLENKGGLVRFGLEPYSTLDEVERTIAAVRAIAAES